MADSAESQREARRRKILQNAEERMNRLLGKSPETANKEEVSLESPTSPAEQHDLTDNAKSPQIHTSPYNLRSRQSRVNSPAEKVSDGLSDYTRASDTISSNREKSSPVLEDETKAEEADKDSEIQPLLKADNEPLPEKVDESLADLCLTHLKKLNAQTFEILKMCTFFFLAFISRQLLKLGIGLFIVPSIFIPFIILELAIIYVSHAYLKHIPLKYARGNMISAALMLCGLKQEVLESYHLIMANTNAALSDFSVYFFAFIVCYGLS